MTCSLIQFNTVYDTAVTHTLMTLL